MTLSVQDLLHRTRAGVAALTESALAARSEPERLGYLAVGELALWARLFNWRRIYPVLRPSLLPLLAGTVLRSGVPGGERVSLLAGLTAGLIGDVEKSRTPDRPSTLGMLGVTGHHLAYSGLLRGRGARVSTAGAALRGVVWAAGIGLAVRQDRQLVPAAVIAGAAVSLSSTLADDPALRSGATARSGLGHGANLVLAAEGLTLLRAALLGRDDLPGRLVDAGVLTATVIGHLLLVDGLVRAQAA